MAEIGFAASIIAIAGAGVKLTMELHRFGSTAVSARTEIDSIAKSVSLYSWTLKMLGAKLKEDKPVHSAEGARAGKRHLPPEL